MPQTGPDLWLHVGLPKTGTTTLQRALTTSDRLLHGAGWLYPLTGRQGIGHHRFVPALVGRRPTLDWIDSSDRTELLCRLTDEITSSAADNILMSSEAFGRLPQASRQLVDELQTRLGEIRPRVVIYLRRQDLYLESHYNQVLKTGARRLTDAELDAITIEELDPLLDYRALLEDYGRFLDPDQIVVCPFERQQLGSDLLSHFLDVIGLRLDEPLSTPSSMNERLNRHALEVLRSTPADLRLVGPTYASLRDRLAAYSARSGPTPCEHLFSLDKRLRILDRYADGNADIARRFLDRDDGNLFLSPAPSEDSLPYPGLPPAEAAAMLLESWTWAFDEITRLRARNSQLERRLRARSDVELVTDH